MLQVKRFSEAFFRTGVDRPQAVTIRRPREVGPVLRLKLLTEWHQLEALRPEWSALLSRAASKDPMLSPAWLLTWWQVYQRDRQLRVGVFYECGRLVGLAPLLKRRFWYRPGIPLWRLEPLGADVDEGDGVGSDYLNVLAEAGRESQVAEALADGLASGAFGKWDEVVLPAMDGDGPIPALICRALQQADLEVECAVTGASPYIPLPASWEAYLQSLSKKKRYGVVRALRDFDTWAGAGAQLHVARTNDELAEGRRVLFSLHNERWQADGMRGAFQAPRFVAFHDALMPRLLAEGRLELIWLTVRDEPIAALYNLVADNKVYFYQSGRKMDVPRGQRPGIVILAKAIQMAIAAGRREFDFLGGVSVYKSQLAPAKHSLVQVRAVQAGLLERVRRLAETGLACARFVRQKTRSAFHWLTRSSQANDLVIPDCVNQC